MTEGFNAGPLDSPVGDVEDRVRPKPGLRPDPKTEIDLSRLTMLAKRRILIVEDDFLIACDIARAVRDLGADVIGPVASTSAARKELESQSCDGAVLDVNLGRETTLDFARELVDAEVPILFVTAYSDYDGLFNEGLESAPRLPKPVTQTVLKRRAGEIFGGVLYH